jgi:hypothetical protein
MGCFKTIITGMAMGSVWVLETAVAFLWFALICSSAGGALPHPPRVLRFLYSHHSALHPNTAGTSGMPGAAGLEHVLQEAVGAAE